MAKKLLVVLTGAGISAESGLTTFRDNGGLWDKYKIEDVATPEAFYKNPALVLEFYNQRRTQLATVKPNPAHYNLAKLQNIFNVNIITQNVDNLHEQAGSNNVLHLHGELTKVRSSKYENLVYDIGTSEIKIGDKCEKGCQLRPHIVWFGEPVPNIEKAIDIVSVADIFLVIGTSLNVYPAAGLINYVKPGVPKFIIDPNEITLPSKLNFKFIKATAVDGTTTLIEQLKNYA